MAEDRRIVICSCEDTMTLDADAVARACAAQVQTATNLCRRQINLFKTLAATTGPLTIACTQEAPLFDETAQALEAKAALTYANIRETAGWSNDAAAAGPKIAALLAAAAEPQAAVPFVSLESKGVTLVYGRDAVAIEAGRRLAARLDVTVLLSDPRDVAPPRVTDFPIAKGTIRTARGYLGAFELTVDDFAQPKPSSRGALAFGPAKSGAISRCDIVVDLSGGTPLFSAPDLRSGYLRADPRDAAAVAALLLDASDLVGTFDKPRYIDFRANLCAHSRSQITGCTRCLDLCPAGAIEPAGDHVKIDPAICAGCGSCAAVCPTGAAEYALPSAEALLRRLRALVLTYRRAGGADALVLFHDRVHGEPLIDALARFGPGLPARVLPVGVNEVTQVGPEALAALFAYGAAGVRFLARAKPRHDQAGLARTIATANRILSALGFGDGPVATIETDDPDQLRAALDAAPSGTVAAQPASFMPMGAKRSLLDVSMRELHRAAPTPVDTIPLDAGAPFGGLEVDVAGCTLCLACVSACPTSALTDNPERPMLRFAENLCVQCGLCAATCPEHVIKLVPRLDFAAWREPRRIKEEEPFPCARCGKPFGTKSAIERVKAKLGDHWMFSGDNEKRLEVLMMCENCRVEVAANEGFDPYAAPARPKPRTTEDYLRERAAGTDEFKDK